MDNLVVLLTFVLLSTTTVVLSADIIKDGQVLILTGENFGDLIDSEPFVLVEFYAPWCGHCKALEPDYAAAANRLYEEGSNILLAKVDATVHKRLASKYEVKGFPTLKFFRGDTEDYIDFAGPRNSEAIYNWVRKKTQPSVTEVKTEAEMEEALGRNRALAVGFFKDATDVPLRAFRKAADDIDETMFVYTTNPELFEVYKIKKENAVVLYKQFDHGRDEMEEELSVVQIKNFVSYNQMEMVVEYGPNSYSQLFSQDIKRHVFLFTNFSAETKTQLKSDLRSVAYRHKDKGYFFVMADTNFAGNVKVFQFFDVTTLEKPSLRYIDMATDEIKKYIPDREEISARGIETFILGVERGLIQQHFKSEEVPEDWDQEPVVVLTGKNFAEVAYDESKAVFVEFYAPWCGHCKNLAPTWEELGENYADQDDIIIAKVDATANEMPDIVVQGYPTLMYFPKGSKEGIRYEGGKDIEEMKKFVDYEGNPPKEDEEDGDSKKDEL